MQKKVLSICLIIALLEGFAGLGIEIYAIRISATYIGSSISITGVILAMVLIAIAAGYWYGGKLSQSIKSPREALLKGGHVLSLAAISHAVACIIQIPLLGIMVYSTDSSIIAAIGVGLLYGVGLMFGSTCIPLITQFLTLQYESEGDHDAGKNAGMMVAVTTIGSVLGSTITPILLLPYVGLMSSLALFIAALAASAWLCTKLASKARNTDSDGVVIKSATANKNYALAAVAFIATIGFISINKLDTGIQTATGAWFINHLEYKGQPVVTISDNPRHTTSSCWIYATKKNCTPYGEYAVDAINNTSSKRLVFLGGAGMAIPSEIAYRSPEKPITVIDIDKGLPSIIGKKFLREPIAKNIEFVGNDARAYFARNQDLNYDFMLIDAFQGNYVASNLYTIEALTRFKQTSKHVMANIIGRPSLDSDYTQTLFSNWQSVFGNSAHVIIKADNEALQNIMLCNFKCGDGQQLYSAHFMNKDMKIHTDNLPRLDRYYYRSL